MLSSSNLARIQFALIETDFATRSQRDSEQSQIEFWIEYHKLVGATGLEPGTPTMSR